MAASVGSFGVCARPRVVSCTKAVCKARVEHLSVLADAKHRKDIRSILSAVASGRVEVQDASSSIEEISCGLHAVRPPVPPIKFVEAPGMAAQDIAQALEQNALEQHTAAARNCSADVYAAVRQQLPGVQYHAGAHMLFFTDSGADVPKPARLPGRVAVVCGSGRDLHGTFEATAALRLMGAYGTQYQGVSAADLPSLVRVRDSIADADVIIVACCEQPALAGLIAGMVAVPVIALPGAGCTDPNAAISAAGVATVAPDDGVSAANAAVRTLRVAANYIQHRKDREAPDQARDEDALPHVQGMAVDAEALSSVL